MLSLQEVLNSIQQNQERFPAAQRLVAGYVVKNYEKIPFLSITALANNIGVSEKTVIKFCNSIGFEKFTEFKHAVADYAQSKLLITSKLSKPDVRKGGDVFSITMKQDIDSIKSTMTLAENKENMPAMIEMLLSAKHIYVIGGRSSAINAQLMTNMLRYLNRKVFTIMPGIGDFYDRLMLIEPEDVVIALCFSRYTAQIVEGLKYLNARNVPIALITDMELSPAFPLAKLVFRCEAASAGYFPSYAGCMSLIYALCSELSRSLGSEATEHVRELENLLREKNVFT